jgi:hypothetical protein
MADSTLFLGDAVPATTDAPRHSGLVRITHWLTTVCFLALLLSGIEILISHPRFYWGETGNVMTPSLFDLPIPAARPWVRTGTGSFCRTRTAEPESPLEAAWAVIQPAWSAWLPASCAAFKNNLLPQAPLTRQGQKTSPASYVSSVGWGGRLVL